MNRYDRPIRNTEQQLDHIYYYTLFHRCTALLLVSFTSHGNNYAAEPKPPFLSQTDILLDFLHPILLCRITYWAPLEMLLLWICIILQTSKKERERKKALKLSGTCRLNAMKEQRTPNCLLGLFTTQKKKLLFITLPPSPNLFIYLFIYVLSF